MNTRNKGVSGLKWIVLIAAQAYYCCGTLCPIQSSNCSQFGVNCEVKKTEDCFNLDHVDGAATSFPGPVTSFDVKLHYLDSKQTPSETTETSLQISWKLPHNDTHKYLLGFEVKLWSVDSQDHTCIVYDISRTLWPAPPYQYQYVYNCTSLTEGQYNVEVVSLPRSPFSNIKETAIIRVIRRNQDCYISQPRCWTTDIVVYNRPCDKRLHVQFQLAPDETRISHYLVSLIYQGSLFPDSTANISHVTGDSRLAHVILNITKQLPLKERIITVHPRGDVCKLNQCRISSTKPFDITQPTEKECVFNYSWLPTDTSALPSNHSTTYQSTLTTVNTRKDYQQTLSLTSSTDSLSSLLEIATVEDCTFVSEVPPIDTHNQTSSGTGLSKAALVGIGIGCILVSGLIIVIIVILTKMHHEYTKQKSQPPLKTIYLIYSNDNQYHQEAVEYFVNFLENVCSCKVTYDKRHLDRVSDRDLWVEDAMKRCDTVILVTSEGCYRRSVAIQNDCTYPSIRYDRSSADLFTPAYRILEQDSTSDGSPLINKLILVHFPYTLPQYRVLDTRRLRNKVNYRLMEEIEDVFRSIHGSITEPLSRKLARYKTTPLTLINRVSSYVQSNPDWFASIYGNPVPNYNTAVSTDLITFDAVKPDGNVIQSAGYTNVSIFMPRMIQDDDCTITSSAFGDMVDDINATRE